jgi:glycosyltransferase involved in cell wall biosynthesis
MNRQPALGEPVGGHPSVSVVIAFFNEETYIQEAVASVFSQRFERWELILVDDGSTDGSGAMAREWAQAHADRVRHLQHPDGRNRGLSASRNLGWQHARGRYVAFLDADDIWLPHKLARQVSILDRHPEVAMVYSRDEFWYSWEAEPQSRHDFVPELGVPDGQALFGPRLLASFIKGSASVPCPTNILVRVDVLRRVDGFDESFPSHYEDQAFYARVLSRYDALALNEVVSRYRQHNASMCATGERSGSQRGGRRVFLNWLEDYLAHQDIRDPYLWKSVRVAQWRLDHPKLARVGRTLRRLGQLLVRRRPQIAIVSHA